MSLACLSHRVSQSLLVLGPCVCHLHQLVLSSLLVLHLVYSERANLKALTRHGPKPLAYQHYRLSSSAVCHVMVHEDVTEDGLLDLVGDSMLKRKRGSKHPVGHKTRLSQYDPDVFGFRIVELVAQGDVYQIPVDFAMIRCTDDPDYQPENALFHQMLQDFRHPAWCQELVVIADVTYASRANLATIQALGYGYVMAPPRTWRFANGKAVKDLVTYLPRGKYTQIRIPNVNTQRHQTFWIDAKRVQLHHLGDVTVVLSICGCNDGPK